ncbi:unnamed protein product [Pylaiella littoralis]
MSIDVSAEPIRGTGPGGRVLKGDVLAHTAAASTAITAARSTRSDTANKYEINAAAAVEEEEEEEDFRQRHQPAGLAAYGFRAAQMPSVVPRVDDYDDVGGDDGLGSLSEAVPRHTSGGRSLGSGRLEGRGAMETAAVRVDGEERECREEEPRLRRRRRRSAGARERREAVSVPIKGVQRAMMEAMQKALEVPHMTFCDEVNADLLGHVRSDLKEAAERRGSRLSYMPLIVKATSMALTAFPPLNASLSEDKKSLLQHPSHNIGVAMDTSRGLLVPCISAVEEMSILDIAEELNTLQRLGAAGKLGEEELSGTTFTLSNIGSIGGTYASPVILHPQVCIGALGRMQRVPRFDVDDIDKVVAAKVFPVSWSADHRVVDGGTLARFSNLWKAYLENPALMLGDTR